jgi:hypothetical protein
MFEWSLGFSLEYPALNISLGDCNRSGIRKVSKLEWEGERLSVREHFVKTSRKKTMEKVRRKIYRERQIGMSISTLEHIPRK